MRKIHLTKTGFNKIKSHHKDLKVSDVEGSLKPIPPGEWCFLQGVGADDIWVGYVNPQIDEKYSCIQVVDGIKAAHTSDFRPENLIVSKLEGAFARRMRFKGYEAGGRIFYGVSDGLNGLIVDFFSNAAVVQINTAGVDRYRDLIGKKVSEIAGVKTYFLDNPKYREKEFLPTFETEAMPQIEVMENGLKYQLDPEVVQKVGFYYDHRENRLQLQNLMDRLQRQFTSGLDLFSYAGSWGLNALKGGAETVDFVDQGDFEKTVGKALDQNGLRGRGRFIRGDVFKFLDSAHSEGKRYDLILCDPPAFAKSALQKPQALEGYSKLHRKALKITAPGALCVFSSCTHYVSHDEFQKNILDAAHKEGKKLQLLHCGMQGWDHPVASLEDRSNYIKSYFYILE